MLFASTGVAAGAFEAIASTVGSGLVVGSFVAGLLATGMSRTRRQAERWMLNGSYFGGLLALLGLTYDILEKHFV